MKNDANSNLENPNFIWCCDCHERMVQYPDAWGDNWSGLFTRCAECAVALVADFYRNVSLREKRAHGNVLM